MGNLNLAFGAMFQSIGDSFRQIADRKGQQALQRERLENIRQLSRERAAEMHRRDARTMQARKDAADLLYEREQKDKKFTRDRDQTRYEDKRADARQASAAEQARWSQERKDKITQSELDRQSRFRIAEIQARGKHAKGGTIVDPQTGAVYLRGHDGQPSELVRFPDGRVMLDTTSLQKVVNDGRRSLEAMQSDLNSNPEEVEQYKKNLAIHEQRLNEALTPAGVEVIDGELLRLPGKEFEDATTEMPQVPQQPGSPSLMDRATGSTVSSRDRLSVPTGEPTTPGVWDTLSHAAASAWDTVSGLASTPAGAPPPAAAPRQPMQLGVPNRAMPPFPEPSPGPPVSGVPPTTPSASPPPAPSLMERATGAASDAWGRVTETAENAWDEVSDTASSVAERVAAWASTVARIFGPTTVDDNPPPVTGRDLAKRLNRKAASGMLREYQGHVDQQINALDRLERTLSPR